jgi:hypothetical protein
MAYTTKRQCAGTTTTRNMSLYSCVLAERQVVPAPERSSKGFCVFSQGANDAANGPCRGRTHIPMRLLTSQRVNLLGVSQEQSKLGDGRLANVNGALEIEPRPYGCSSPKPRMAEVGVSPFLACPIV